MCRGEPWEFSGTSILKTSSTKANCVFALSVTVSTLSLACCSKLPSSSSQSSVSACFSKAEMVLSNQWVSKSSFLRTFGLVLCLLYFRLTKCGLHVLFTGKVVLQWGEQMSDYRNAPGPPKQLLSGATAHVGHICVVDRKAKNPGKTREREICLGQLTFLPLMTSFFETTHLCLCQFYGNGHFHCCTEGGAVTHLLKSYMNLQKTNSS